MKSIIEEVVVSALGFNSPSGVDFFNFISKERNIDNGIMLLENYDPQKYLKPKGQRFLNKATLIYCNVAFDAIHHRDLSHEIKKNPDRIGLYDGTELSNLEDCFAFDLTAKNLSPSRVSPMKAPSTIANAAASQMAIQSGIKGPNFSVCAGMAGSLQALDVAHLHIRQDIVDYAVVASSEVRNVYQASIWRSMEQGKRESSPEFGISMVLETMDSVVRANRKPLLSLKQFYTETFAGRNKSLEDYLIRCVQKILGQFNFDTLIISGGTSVINLMQFEQLLDQNIKEVHILCPENEVGGCDNAGGMVGIGYAIAIFNDQLSYKTQCDNVVVMSIDSVGTLIYCVVGKTEI